MYMNIYKDKLLLEIIITKGKIIFIYPHLIAIDLRNPLMTICLIIFKHTIGIFV